MVQNIINGHANNLLTSTSTNEATGWTIDCSDGVWNADGRQYDETCYNWYGWNTGDPVGSISTTLYGGGRARLNFGNCWSDSGYVVAELDGKSLVTEQNKVNENIFEFNFGHESTLTLREYSGTIIQANLDLSVRSL